MRLIEDIKPVTYLKTQAAELLRRVRESRRPVIITQNGEARAVVMDIDSYQQIRDAILLLKMVAQGEAYVRTGDVVEQDAVFKQLRSSIPKK
jgi:prevent-host-death family protein